MKEIKTYDMTEQAAMCNFSNRVIEAFQCHVFNTIGYPTRIKSEFELWRYHDVMQEHSFSRNVERRFNTGLSQIEFELFKEAMELVRQFGCTLKKPRGVKLSGRNSLIVSLYQMRVINAILKSFFGKNPQILELGPGSGYLALLNALQGLTQYTFDASQAFTIYQGSLFSFTEQQKRLFVKPQQIHWWEFAGGTVNLDQIDVVIGNHMLAEMHNHCLRFVLDKITSAWNRRDRKLFNGGLFLAESIGSEHSNSHASVVKAFSDFGFGLVTILGDFDVFYYGFDNSIVQRNLTHILHELDSTHRDISRSEIIEYVNNGYSEPSPDEVFWETIKLPL